MWDVEEVTTPIAKKDYHCQASDWIDETLGWDELEYAESDREVLRKAQSENCKILKGEKYLKVKGKWDGDWQTFRARLDLDEICKKYDLYQE